MRVLFFGSLAVVFVASAAATAVLAEEGAPTAWETQALGVGRQASALFKSAQSKPREFDIKSAIDAYARKCPKGEPLCFVTECDAGMSACRPDRVLLFRGEAKFFGPTPSSALLRDCRNGGQFCSGLGPEAALERLAEAVSLFRPVATVPNAYREIVLVKDANGGGAKWVYRSQLASGAEQEPGAEFAGGDSSGADALSLRQILYYSHKVAAYMYYRDSSKQVLSLDPLISFTSNPAIAVTFGVAGNRELFEDGKVKPPEPSRFIVISVSQSEIDADCGESLPSPGRILNPAGCGQKRFAYEDELPAVLLVEPEDFIGNFRVPAPVENAADDVLPSSAPRNQYWWQYKCRQEPQWCGAGRP